MIYFLILELLTFCFCHLYYGRKTEIGRVLSKSPCIGFRNSTIIHANNASLLGLQNVYRPLSKLNFRTNYNYPNYFPVFPRHLLHS